MTEWRVGDRIRDEWEIYNVLRGGMGIVYITFDKNRSLFAMKTFQDEIFTLNPGIAARFNQEVYAWINLDSHQNVVRAAYLENIEGKPYLIMEYVGGGDLGGWINTPRLINNLPQILRFAIQFCDGMSHALSKGIRAHRDLKPQNCMIAQDNTLKISDFGLARIIDNVPEALTADPAPANASPHLTRTGTAAGTCSHMAPEQFDDAKHVDVRADIYSFGIILFQMIRGELPFTGRTWADFERLHKMQALPPVGSGSASLDRVVERCLVKDPVHRFASFDECREELVDAYEELTGSPAPRPLAGQQLTATELALKSQSLSYLGRHAEGLACAESSLQIDSLMELAWNNKGMALGGLGRHKEAIECYDRALELAPRAAISWSNKGYVLSELGRAREGIACCDRAIELNPLIEMSWSNKAKCLAEIGEYGEALKCIERALELNPRSDWSLYNMGCVLEKTGSREEAVAWYRRALDVNPRLSLALNNVANVLSDSEQYEEALVFLDRALYFDSNSWEVWSNKGRALTGLERDAEAIACYDRAIELRPNAAVIWSNKGTTLSLLGRHQEALTCFDRAYELSPREKRIWSGRGCTLSNLGRQEEALKCFDREIELDPDWDMVWFFKGITLAQLGRMEKAIVCMGRAVELNKGNAVAWCRKGDMHASLGRCEEALDCYVNAIKAAPLMPDAWFGKGMSFARTGHVTHAVECFQQAQSLGHPDAAEAIEVCQGLLEES